MRAGIVVDVACADRRRLEAIGADRRAQQKHVCCANIILATRMAAAMAEVMRRSGKSRPVVRSGQARFMTEGVAGLMRDKTPKTHDYKRHVILKSGLYVDTVDPEVNVALGGQVAIKPAGVFVDPSSFSRAMVEADSPPASLPSKAANASSKSPVEMPFK